MDAAHLPPATRAAPILAYPPTSLLHRKRKIRYNILLCKKPPSLRVPPPLLEYFGGGGIYQTREPYGIFLAKKYFSNAAPILTNFIHEQDPSGSHLDNNFLRIKMSGTF
ncbi:hypothetical protein NPIL_690741 [Nephila pilipes]|uniref:Uncharacterized protein n=1 Tax=Nephila pilipes TaxID=299642 RepID=A0A8X6QR65_NEPPI|nr:hypothetical protein NPIL_690741 [Nephila pilipes]